MKIHDLFVKPVDRNIEGVIKAADVRFLQTEVEEFVVTTEIAKGLDHFVERYLEDKNANGTWISGFFGSGKSHLLKMLSLLLDDKTLPNGVHPSEILLPKIEDEVVRGNFQRAVRIPSHSILFNVDQKADANASDKDSAILDVFLKVLNEFQGYHANQPYIAQFEHDLEINGQFAPFKETYERVNGNSWEKDRNLLSTLRKKDFAKAYSAHFDVSEEAALDNLSEIRDHFRYSIESFAQRVKDYLDTQSPDFRLNFFVDEVGQFIGENSKLMLNLQTIAETLATVCEGRAWVFVTSQGDLQRILGDLDRASAQDFTKIQARFKTRLSLSSADVREVIQKRLLYKKEAEPEVLTDIYDAEKDNFQTLFRFGDKSIAYKTWRGSDEFCDFYPFHPYQFDLFQRCIEQLSKHNAFTGKHTSVGERSMIEVFQSVLKTIHLDPVGKLGSFDQMFDGIASNIRGDMLTSLKQATKQLDDDTSTRILKALFLLKWVRDFKPTPRNIAILLINNPHVNIHEHEKMVQQALHGLASQSYLQKNGEYYEFLTDIEKDIETEIKSTSIDGSEVTKLLKDIIFADILKDQKIRYEGNGQDYAVRPMIDGELVGKDADIGINIITPEHLHYKQPNVLAAQNTGKSELMAILPDDPQLMDEVRLHLKTKKYVSNESGSNIDPGRATILRERQNQLHNRRTAIEKKIAAHLSNATLFLNETRLDDIGTGEARNRYAKAGQRLVSTSFPCLRMLKGTYNEQSLREAFFDVDTLLAGEHVRIEEPEQEILDYVTRNQSSGERTVLDKILQAFSRQPYGWYTLATLTLIARLYSKGKLEIRQHAILDARAAYDAFGNTRMHGALRISILKEFDPRKVNALKRFHHDFFHKSNPENDARGAAKETLLALGKEADALASLLRQERSYPFLSRLKPIYERILKISEKDYNYVLEELDSFEGELLDAMDDLLDPIKGFIAGEQRQVYDEVMDFMNRNQGNLTQIDPSQITTLLSVQNHPTPYRGTLLSNAKGELQVAQAAIEASLRQEKEAALQKLQEAENRIKISPDFVQLDPVDQIRILELSEKKRQEISSSRIVLGVQSLINEYEQTVYPSQLQKAASLVQQQQTPPSDQPQGIKVDEPKYKPSRQIRANCALTYISDEQQLDEWLASLREAALEELKKGYRISL